MSSRAISRRFSLFLDAARGIAALAVVAQHARTYLFVGPKALSAPSLPVRAFYFVTGFGHEAVMVFFVLSGFLVGGSALSAIERDRWSWGDYLAKRVTRLSIVLVPALLLTLAWDRALIAQFGAHSFPLRDSAFSLGDHTWTARNSSVVTMLGNAFFLMNVWVPTFGTNGALWSLANEFWYYVAFPLAALAIVGRRDSLRAIACVLTLVVLYYVLGRDIAKWGAIWLMGVAVARVPLVRARPDVLRAGAMASVLLLAAVLWHDRGITTGVEFSRDVLVGGAFTLMLYAVRCALSGDDVSSRRDTPLATAATRFAAFSYTLYLVHESPLAFMHSWIGFREHAYWRPTAAHVAIYALVVVALVAYARGIAMLTEDRTDALRAWLRRVVAARAEPVIALGSEPAAS